MHTRRSFEHAPLTAHALARSQQRGISRQAIQLAIDFGQWFNAGEGRTAAYLGRKAVRAALKAWGLDLDRHQNVAVILSRDGTVVTVRHVPRPLRSWRGE